MRKLLFILFLFIFSRAEAQITYAEFQNLISVFHHVYDGELQKQNSKMIINSGATVEANDMWWNFPNRHASYSSYVESDGIHVHFIFIFGGYAKIAGMTHEGVAMTMCHELGHGIGGTPFKNNPGEPNISVEGQADYFAARLCIKRILKFLAPANFLTPLLPTSELKCQQAFSLNSDFEMCRRSFNMLEIERLYFRTQEGIEQETDFDTPETAIAAKTETDPYYYPSAQCRLDTMVAGILEQPAPSCWYQPDISK